MKQTILRTLSLAIGMGCLSLPAIGQKPKVFPDYTYVYEPSDSLQMTPLIRKPITGCRSCK